MTRKKFAGSILLVPIGSESFVADSLVKNNVAYRLNHASSTCGGLETSYFEVSKSKIGIDLTKVDQFGLYLARRLRSHLDASSTFTDTGSYTSPIPPHYSRKRFSLVVPSVLSRGQAAGDTWDKFDLIFTLYKSDSLSYTIEIHAENLLTAPKVAVKSRPPSQEFFQKMPDGDSYVAEYVVASSFSNYFAGDPTKCLINVDGFIPDMTPFKCRD